MYVKVWQCKLENSAAFCGSFFARPEPGLAADVFALHLELNLLFKLHDRQKLHRVIPTAGRTVVRISLLMSPDSTSISCLYRIHHIGSVTEPCKRLSCPCR